MKISVIIPFYHSEKTIISAVESVYAQSFDDFEIIIIDDSNSIQLRNLVSKYKAIKVIKNVLVNGAGNARKEGFNAASGDFIMLLDSDDIWLPGTKLKQLKYMTTNNFAVCASAYLQKLSAKDKKGAILAKYWPRCELTHDDLLRSCWVGNSSLIFEANFLEKYKHYYNNIEKEDYDFNLTISKFTDIGYYHYPTYEYVLSPNSVSAKKISEVRKQLKILQRHKSKIKSYYYLVFYIFFALSNIMHRRYFTTKKIFLMGGFGNQLFQKHLGYNLKSKGYNIVYYDFLTRLNLLTKILNWRIHKKVHLGEQQAVATPSIKIIFILVFAFFEKKFLNTRFFWENSAHSHCIGYFQDNISLCSDAIEKLREEFLLQVAKNVEYKMAVHLRFGDSVWETSHSWILDALEKVPQQDVYIATDDKARAQELLKHFSSITFHYGNSEEQDFLALATSENIICGNSTFSLWAALLNINVKHIYAPSRFKVFNLDKIVKARIFWK